MQWHKHIDTDHLLQFVYLIPYKGSWDHKCDKPLLRRLEIPISLTTWGDALFIYDEKKYCSIYIRQIKLLEYICGSITRYEFRMALQIWLDYLLYHEWFIVNKDCFDGRVFETILVSCIIARLFHKLAISSSKCSRRLYSYTYWDINYLFVRMDAYKPIYFTSTSNMIYLLRKWRYFCGI